MEKNKISGGRVIVLLLVAAMVVLMPAAALAGENGETILGPLAMEHGSIDVGGTSLVIATIQTEDGTLPEGMTISWSVSDENAATIAPEPGSDDTAVVTGVAPANEVTVTAQLLDADGSFTNEISNTVVQVNGDTGDGGDDGGGETNAVTLGPITLEHGSIEVGETSLVIATIRTDDGKLPAGTDIQWSSSDDSAASVDANADAPEQAVVTGIAPAEDVTINAQLVDTDGSLTDEISAVTIQVTAGETTGSTTWSWIVVIVVVAVVLIVLAVVRSRKRSGR